MKNYKFKFQSEPNPGRAKPLYKAELAAVQRELDAVTRKADQARAKGQRVFEMEAIEEAAAISEKLTYLNHAWSQFERGALEAEYENRERILKAFEADIQTLDEKLVEALLEAWKLSKQRAETYHQYSTTRNRIANTARRYNLPHQLHPTDGVRTCWGRVLKGHSPRERGQQTFVAYADRFIRFTNAGMLPETLTEFISRKVEK